MICLFVSIIWNSLIFTFPSLNALRISIASVSAIPDFAWYRIGNKISGTCLRNAIRFLEHVFVFAITCCWWCNAAYALCLFILLRPPLKLIIAIKKYRFYANANLKCCNLPCMLKYQLLNNQTTSAPPVSKLTPSFLLQRWIRLWTWQPAKWTTAALSSLGSHQSLKLITTCSPTSQPTAAGRYVALTAPASKLRF